MIYWLFWYMVVVCVGSFLANVYFAVNATNKTNGQKVGQLIGNTIRTALTGIFLYAVYPVLTFVN